MRAPREAHPASEAMSDLLRTPRVVPAMHPPATAFHASSVLRTEETTHSDAAKTAATDANRIEFVRMILNELRSAAEDSPRRTGASLHAA